jgi:hypothetical protein
MTGPSTLEERLALYGGGRIGGRRGPFRQGQLRGLRERIQAQLEAAVARFEIDRAVYEIEVDAMHAWLRNLVAFDAYCARRARP